MKGDPKTLRELKDYFLGRAAENETRAEIEPDRLWYSAKADTYRRCAEKVDLLIDKGMKGDQ